MQMLFDGLQLLLAVWMWFLIGQGLVMLVAMGRHATNPVYRGMALVTWPPMKLARLLAPKLIVDRHIPILALLLVIAARVGLYMLFYSQNWIGSAANL